MAQSPTMAQLPQGRRGGPSLSSSWRKYSGGAGGRAPAAAAPHRRTRPDRRDEKGPPRRVTHSVWWDTPTKAMCAEATLPESPSRLFVDWAQVDFEPLGRMPAKRGWRSELLNKNATVALNDPTRGRVVRSAGELNGLQSDAFGLFQHCCKRARRQSQSTLLGYHPVADMPQAGLGKLVGAGLPSQRYLTSEASTPDPAGAVWEAWNPTAIRERDAVISGRFRV